MAQVHTPDAIKQILPFLAFVSFLIFYNYTGDAADLGFQTCLERFTGKAQPSPGSSAQQPGSFQLSLSTGYTEQAADNAFISK